MLQQTQKIELMCLLVFLSCVFFCVSNRALDILSDEVLLDVSAAYRQMVSHTTMTYGLFLKQMGFFFISYIFGLCA